MQIFFHRRDFNPEVSTWKLYLRQQAPGWQRGTSLLKSGRMTTVREGKEKENRKRDVFSVWPCLGNCTFESWEADTCQKAFNGRLPVGCFGSVMNPLFLINSWGIKSRGKPFLDWGMEAFPSLFFQYGDKYPPLSYEPYIKNNCLQLSLFNRDCLL